MVSNLIEWEKSYLFILWKQQFKISEKLYSVPLISCVTKDQNIYISGL